MFVPMPSSYPVDADLRNGIRRRIRLVKQSVLPLFRPRKLFLLSRGNLSSAEVSFSTVSCICLHLWRECSLWVPSVSCLRLLMRLSVFCWISVTALFINLLSMSPAPLCPTPYLLGLVKDLSLGLVLPLSFCQPLGCIPQLSWLLEDRLKSILELVLADCQNRELLYPFYWDLSIAICWVKLFLTIFLVFGSVVANISEFWLVLCSLVVQ